MPLFKCRDHGYTLGSTCSKCGRATFRPGPAKYSPEDAYGEYRRRLKRQDRGRVTSGAARVPAAEERS